MELIEQLDYPKQCVMRLPNYLYIYLMPNKSCMQFTLKNILQSYTIIIALTFLFEITMKSKNAK